MLTPGRPRDLGESLLEVLIAMAILGIAVVAILGAMTTLVLGTDVHRKQSSATAVLLSAAEAVKDPGNTYVSCATQPTYAAAAGSVSRPAGWAAPVVTEVTYWNGSVFQATCYDTPAYGNQLRLQRISLEVRDPGSRAVEKLTLVKRSEP